MTYIFTVNVFWYIVFLNKYNTYDPISSTVLQAQLSFELSVTQMQLKHMHMLSLFV